MLVTKIKSLFISVFLLSLTVSSVFAGDHRLTKEEFLSGVEKGTITLDRAPVLAVSPAAMEKVFSAQRKAFPIFKPEMFYVAFIKDNKFIYSLFFEWASNRCLLRIEELDAKLGKPNEKTMDPNGQQVEKKYCEKALGTKL